MYLTIIGSGFHSFSYSIVTSMVASICNNIWKPKRPKPQDTNHTRRDTKPTAHPEHMPSLEPTYSITDHGSITIKRFVTPTPRIAMSVDVWR